MPQRALNPVMPARRASARGCCRFATAVAVCLLAGRAGPVPVPLSGVAGYELPSEGRDANAEPTALPLLGDALSGVEPGTPRWLDQVLASEQGTFLLDEIVGRPSERQPLSQRSILMLSRLLFDRPPSASAEGPGHDKPSVESRSEVGNPTGAPAWQWTGGGLGGSSYSFAVGADADDAPASAPAQTDPAAGKLLPVLDYLRENRYSILGMIAAFLVVGAVGVRLIDRRVD